MQYLRRFLWYIAKRLLGVTLLFGALIIAFYMAMNTSNILILLKDGMALRAQVIMMEEEPASLTKFFQEDFVRLDTALNVGLSSESPYADYDITGIDHRVTLEWMWCWPWDDTASADFVESVPKIDGRIKSSLRAEAEANDPSSVYPPAWSTSRYRATLVRENGRWKIASLKLMETLP
ncbi:MAG: hypothetical protein UFE80_02870 [Christensenellales bacterium]|uniref:Uncharacterized protein n=1 Tax=Candidatus Avichristensenella intestinipullorum TaxID=2840693 RepID=A0A9D0YXZ9_9FIRM|nr:hypothetical protein [Christensenellales bacterium]HIQ62925.1 hypothetical protein [Candidatus Avichristensenella intestinipullorum]